MIPMPIYNAMLYGPSRLRKQLATNSTFCKGFAVDAEWKLIQRSIRLDVTEAYNVYADCKKTILDASDYPQCVPPWPTSWCEYSVKPEMWIDGQVCQVPQMHLGCFTFHADTYNAPPELRTKFTGKLIKELKLNQPGGFETVEDNVRHVVVMRHWMLAGGAAIPCDMRLLCLLDASGQLLRWEFLAGNTARGRNGEFTTNDAAAFFHPMLFAFSLANCKNIVAEEQTAVVDDESYKGRIKAMKKRSYRYHVLKITGSLTGQSSEGSGGSADKAMHICRGNFARYTDDKPLFGKYTGLFWRPMHVRGSVKNGVVDKDYAIATNPTPA